MKLECKVNINEGAIQAMDKLDQSKKLRHFAYFVAAIVGGGPFLFGLAAVIRAFH
ncbi:hypothetical protein JGUZn3_22230 [Entomobacter blattae]|uniref:Uncharacterized protein n=1 Tax=Entomobacter blattae TaxID=2762277 RepID=A0A7H1NUG4_9PROT|nr:hypothetical protein JGUZn3_22230 [Entomobacter blattae]